VKLSVLTPLAAAVLLASPPLLAQSSLSERVQSLFTEARDCVVAGPSKGDCRALGRYSQSYRDVEGGLLETPRATAARDAQDEAASTQGGAAQRLAQLAAVGGQAQADAHP
jgi:hypothetical protein